MIIEQTVDNPDVKELVKLLCDHAKEKSQSRVTVIVGAGASRSSPSTQNLIDGIKAKYSKDALQTNAHLTYGKALDECTLEELCSLHSKFSTEEEVRHYLTSFKINDKRIVNAEKDVFRPTPGYEYLAHLFHNRLINTIITTNFDEELEASIDDEIGRENYQLIKSKSEFDQLNEKWNIKEPQTDERFLFKVHGTISYPATIRSTIDLVKRFEPEKFEVLKRVLTNTAILIIVGFAFADIDFKQVFVDSLRHSHQPLKFYWISRSKSAEGSYRKENFHEISALIERQGEKPTFIISPESPNPSGLGGSDRFFELLAEEVGEGPHGNIPTIARHKLRNLILQKVAPENIEQAKFHLETALFAVKSKGLFSIEALTDCPRMKRYCKELKANGKANPHELFRDLEKAGLIKNDQKKVGLYYIPAFDHLDDISQIVDRLLIVFNLKDSFSEDEYLQMKEQLRDLRNTFDVDVVPPHESEYIMFANPKPIETHNAWDNYTEILVKQASELFIIAQTGEWIVRNKPLFEDFLKKKKSMIKLICCANSDSMSMHNSRQTEIEEELIKLDNGTRKIQLRYLPWETINEHLKMNDKQQGMYMRRIAKSPKVSPVWLENNDDYEKLKCIFYYYWNMAKKSRRFPSERTQDIGKYLGKTNNVGQGPVNCT